MIQLATNTYLLRLTCQTHTRAMKPGLFAGAMSMAAGEYISVASQRDTEQADVDKERAAQNSGPQMRQQELDELAQIYVERGLTERLAREVAVALTEKDAVRAHARVRCTFLLPVCPLLQLLLVVYTVSCLLYC